MKSYSLKEKKYNILEEFCKNHFQDIEINLIIIDSKIDESYILPLNLINHNTLIIIPYISNPSLIIDHLELIEINQKEGEFISFLDKLEIGINSYKAFNIQNFKSVIDYIDIQTGKIVGSVFSYRIKNDFITIISTNELFLLNRTELETNFSVIFSSIIREYKQILEIEQESRENNNRLRIEYLLNGNPLPILISQFGINQVEKKEFWSKWEKLENLTNLFSKKKLISTIDKLKDFKYIKEQDNYYVFQPLVIELSKKYHKFGMKLLGS